MKIVGVSNFDAPSVSDILICENVNLVYSDIIIHNLNADSEEAKYYFELKEDDYKLYDSSTLYL